MALQAKGVGCWVGEVIMKVITAALEFWNYRYSQKEQKET
jgi:hypothetical protein